MPRHTAHLGSRGSVTDTHAGLTAMRMRYSLCSAHSLEAVDTGREGLLGESSLKLRGTAQVQVTG